MAQLKLNFESLLTMSQTLEVAKGNYDQKNIFKRFHEQTADAKSPLYSGYRDQILAREGLKEAIEAAKEFRAQFSNLIVLGIGGSALGARAIFEALRERIPANDGREIRIIDNLDPLYFQRQIAGLDWKKTAVAVISKSGGTIETMAQFSWISDHMRAQNLEMKKHFIAITDPKSGALLEWAKKESVKTLFVPPTVGGRYSVFTPVGIFPLAFAGLNVEKLFDGAIAQFKEKSGIKLEETYALATRLKDFENAGYLAHVLFSYSSVLRECGAWFTQLWGESLGKIHPRGHRTGSFPMPAIGATDQHSLLQLLMEGSKKAVVSFLRIEEWPKNEFKMGQLPEALRPKLAFAEGKSFAEILNAEATATLKALSSSGRPVFQLSLEKLDESNLGAWLAYSMDLTSMMGAVHGIQPYDQPGVEAGKRILPEIL